MKTLNRSVLILSFALFCHVAEAQKKNEIIMKIGKTQVTKDEFVANYKKNNTNILDEKDRKTPTEYLDLYTNFKLKVLEAESLGYDTISSYVTELKGYRTELAKPYLTDVSFNEEMVQTAYYRTLHERKASHILIRVTPESSPADTLTAWNKISELRKQISEGADFNELAAQNSEDPSAAQNKGLLGYFSAFQMVYPFEEATYRTPVGQVSEIIRTRFGYHIIFVHDERLTPGEIRVAHIMKMFPQQASEETIENLRLSTDSIWQRATSGEDFAELAKMYSDDKQTAPAGGEMRWFSPTNMVPAFAEAAFALKNDGDISPVIRTPYGWHIIKRLELRTPETFEKLRPELETKIKQNPSISKYSDEAFDHKLRQEYGLKINEQNLKLVAEQIADTTKHELAKAISTNQLISFANQTFSTGDFYTYLQTQKFSPSASNQENELKTQLDKFINQKLLEYEDTQLERKHPDFARVYQEYHDGILLFNISKDKIWDVASTDSLRLQKYFDQTDKKYYWGERFKGWIIETKTAELRSKIESLFDEKDLSKQEINDLFNTPEENNVLITDVAAEKGDNPIVDYFIWSGPKPADFNETTTFVHGKKTENDLKLLTEAWGLYSSDFQEQIEKEWIESLRKKFPIKINKRILKKIPMVE